jgi:ribosome biogenesis GTPase
MKGVVIKTTGSWYRIKDQQNTIHNCRIRGKFRIKGIKSTNPVAVGDFVEFDVVDDENKVIHTIHDRTNYIIRKATNLSKQTHIIAANVDQALIIVTLAQPRTPLGFIDRFLATAEVYDIPVKIIINKSDLISDEQLTAFKAIYEPIGYPCLVTSATNKTGLDAFKNTIAHKTSLLSGHSGVGKSSLINSIEPTLDIKTSEISDSNEKGKHTTTFAEMFELSIGGNIIDTPGIRSFGVVDVEKEDLWHYFKEIFQYGKDCKFNNCQHINEPHCAVKNAVDNDEISITRYDNYIHLYNGEEFEKDYK